MIHQNFGEMLKDILYVKRMEKKDLAKKLKGIHPSNITRYLSEKTATTKLITRLNKALEVEIISKDGGYLWIDLTKKSKEIDIVNEPIDTYSADIHLEKAKAIVKKRLHDAIVEACMQTPEEHRPKIFRYFLNFESDSNL